MARIWSCGFELNSKTAGVEATAFGADANIVSTNVRSGSFCVRVNPNAATSGIVRYQFVSANATAGYYFRIYIYVLSYPAALYRVLDVQETGGASRAAIKMNTNGTLELHDQFGGVQIGSDSSVIPLATWTRVELFYDTTTAASSVITGRLNGSQFASGTVDQTGALGQGRIHLGDDGTSTFDFLYDDVAINDTSGSFQNSWPGDGKIIHLRPNAAGDTDEWDGTTTYEDIDEVTPDDVTTIIASLTSGQTHEVNLDATPNLISSDDTINLVQVGVRFNESVGTDPDPTFVLRIKASAAGMTEESSDITANSTSFGTNAAANPRNYQLTLYDLPGASTTAWTKTNLDAAQIGVRLTNTPVGSAQVSTMWLLVDYTPIERAAGVFYPYKSAPLKT